MAFAKILNNLKERKRRVESGKYNCLPFPFERFRIFFPGIEKGQYVLITANEKVGKSKFADFLFVYEVIFFAIEHPEFHFHVIYFTLEMSPQDKYLEFLSHLLFKLDNIVIAPSDLRSVDNKHPVPQYILDKLETERYQQYIKFYEEHVEYFCESSNPTGLRKIVRAYANKNGKYNHVAYEVVDDVTGEKQIRMKLDPIEPYTPNDPEEYVFIITDNAANITTESGMSEKETIDKWSKDCISFANDLKYIPILIQHQAFACTIKFILVYLYINTYRYAKNRTESNFRYFKH